MNIKIKIILAAALLGISYYGNIEYKRVSKIKAIEKSKLERIALRNNLKHSLNQSFSHSVSYKDEIWPKSHLANGENYNIEYTFDRGLTKYIKKILKRYGSDYSAVIVMDNKSGKILSAIGYQRQGNQFNVSLPFSSTHPSASLFKIITSAALLESKKVDKNTIFNYRGKGTTLYKYQLDQKRTRWTRYLTFKKAFAFSNNVIFGKAAISNIAGEDLYNQAVEFGFNSNIMNELDLSKSVIDYPSSQYNMAEIASGFNKETMISPLHGALISSVVANGGLFQTPYIIDKLVSDNNGKNIWSRKPDLKRILTKNTSSQLSELMETTVKSGTARGSFRKLRRKLKSKLRIGGKTGTITGGLPYGKRDWFTAYAMPKDSENDTGISICVMNVNVNKWYVKSTYLAKSIIEYYYKNKFNIKKKTKKIVYTK